MVLSVIIQFALVINIHVIAPLTQALSSAPQLLIRLIIQENQNIVVLVFPNMESVVTSNMVAMDILSTIGTGSPGTSNMGIPNASDTVTLSVNSSVARSTEILAIAQSIEAMVTHIVGDLDSQDIVATDLNS